MPAMQYYETGSVDPAYNLAFEEYILSHRRDGSILILWQNENAVIIGRNQNTQEEIHQGFVAENSIAVIRRNTGGGAVYHDLGNLNYSFISDADSIDQAATQLFISPVVNALRALGLNAEFSGRNDILISGRKVSGTAQQFSHGRLLLHGTLLFDSDPDKLAGALNPDPTKFQSKSVKSVRKRVGNIRSFLKQDMDVAAFWTFLKTYLAGDHTVPASLTARERAAVQALKQSKYDTWEWNYGKSPKYDIRQKKRWPGGLLDIRMTVASGMIQSIRIFGDFLALQPLSSLEDVLCGCPLRTDSLHAALETVPVEQFVGTVTREELIQTILGE